MQRSKPLLSGGEFVWMSYHGATTNGEFCLQPLNPQAADKWIGLVGS